MARAINTTTNAHNVYRTDNFDRLCADIRKAPVLTEQEQDSLLRSYATATEDGRQEIKERVTKSNLRFVLSLAKKYTGDADLISALVSLGTIGLYKAVEDFDPDKDFKFLSYAVHKVRSVFSEYFRSEHDLVRRSNGAVIGNKDLKVAERLYKELHREPSEEEVMDALYEEYGIEVKCKADVIRVKTDSLSERVDEDGAERGEVGEIAVRTASVNGYVEQAEQEDREHKVARLLSALPVKNRDILSRAFGIGYDRPMEDAEIAEALGYTSENVRILKRDSLKTLRKIARAYGIAL